MTTSLSFPWEQYWFCVLGILISIVLPVLRAFLPVPKRLRDDVALWKTYLAIGLFSLLSAVLITAYYHNSVEHWVWQDSLLAGYAWDSTLQKLLKP